MTRNRPHTGDPMGSKQTGRKAASKASKTLLKPSSPSKAKSAAGSALAQKGNNKVTSAAAASKAAKVLSNPKSSKAAKSAAASALAQKPSKKGKK